MRSLMFVAFFLVPSLAIAGPLQYAVISISNAPGVETPRLAAEIDSKIERLWREARSPSIRRLRPPLSQQNANTVFIIEGRDATFEDARLALTSIDGKVVFSESLESILSYARDRNIHDPDTEYSAILEGLTTGSLGQRMRYALRLSQGRSPEFDRLLMSRRSREDFRIVSSAIFRTAMEIATVYNTALRNQVLSNELVMLRLAVGRLSESLAALDNQHATFLAIHLLPAAGFAGLDHNLHNERMLKRTIATFFDAAASNLAETQAAYSYKKSGDLNAYYKLLESKSESTFRHLPGTRRSVGYYDLKYIQEDPFRNQPYKPWFLLFLGIRSPGERAALTAKISNSLLRLERHLTRISADADDQWEGHPMLDQLLWGIADMPQICARMRSDVVLSDTFRLDTPYYSPDLAVASGAVILTEILRKTRHPGLYRVALDAALSFTRNVDENRVNGDLVEALKALNTEIQNGLLRGLKNIEASSHVLCIDSLTPTR